MKIIWWSPTASVFATGYGIVTKYMVDQLHALGHDVYEVQIYGNRNIAAVIGGHKILPSPYQDNGLAMVPYWAEKTKADLVIYHGDSWAVHASLRTMTWPLYIYTVLDHDPLSPLLAQSTKGPSTLGWALPSIWSIDVARRAGLEPDYIPYGHNPEIYRPGDRLEARRAMGWPADKWIYLAVGANYGDRKNLTNLLRAYAMMLERRPLLREKTLLALYTYPTLDSRNPQGFALDWLAQRLGIIRNVAFPIDPHEVILGIPEDVLAKHYQAADVFTLPSKAEGFGLPFLESMACGVPCIGTRWSAMTELIEGHGWLLDPIEYEVGQLTFDGYYALPSTFELSKLMEWTYDNQDAVRVASVKAQEFARHWTWEATRPRWDAVLKRLAIESAAMVDLPEAAEPVETVIIGKEED